MALIRPLVVVAAIAGLGAWSPAQSQSIYKYVHPDGRVVYSDKPVPGARLEEELLPPPPPDPAAAEAARARGGKDAAALEKAADKRAQSLDEAWEDLRRWTARLERARADLEAGREPREGERLGTVSGRSRLSGAYWSRQQANQAAVREAEARVRRAQDAINALR
jgi:hypothetical protein